MAEIGCLYMHALQVHILGEESRQAELDLREQNIFFVAGSQQFQ
jgi:hypothetical protein